MIDIKDLRDNLDKYKDGLKKKGVDVKVIDLFFDFDKKWRELTTKVDEGRAEQKKISGGPGLSKGDIAKAKVLKNKIKKWEDELKVVDQERLKVLGELPNLPAEDALVGHDQSANKVLREGGVKLDFDFEPLDYLTLGEKLGLIDVKQAAKATGARFGYLKGGAALLELALIDFVFKKLVADGFVPVVPPVMIKPAVLREMGKGKFIDAGDAFYIAEDDLYLVGSSEHTIGPLHKDDVFSEKELPIKYVAFSTCFRREAGSYGKDTRGILRVHQFDKVEMFVFSHPDKSFSELEKLVKIQESFVKELGLPYRVVEVATGDMGWGDAKQYDIEVWFPTQKTYRETNSASNTTDFQARGINARFRGGESKLDYVHTLNATAVAIGRMVIAIIENNQTKEGWVKVPKPLQKYLGIKLIKN